MYQDGPQQLTAAGEKALHKVKARIIEHENRLRGQSEGVRDLVSAPRSAAAARRSSVAPRTHRES
jgi:hypothetical protein